MKRRRGYFRKARTTKIGEELTSLRIRQGLTQEEVGGRLHKSKSYICKLETSRKTLPFDILTGFAVACGARPEHLVGKLHQLQLPLLNAIITPAQMASDPLSDLTSEEKEELVRYLAFLRLKRTKIDLP